MSRPPDDRMNELRQLFFESAVELVENLNEQALRLEMTPGDAETARSLRRIVHTLKGDAAACGYRELSEVAHEFEDVLALKTNLTIIPEVALRVADLFAGLIEAYRTGKKVPDCRPLRAEIARLAHAQASASPADSADAAMRKSQGETSPWSEYERLAIAHAVADGKHPLHVVVHLDPQCGMPIAARQMIQIALASIGEVLGIFPPEGFSGPIDRIQVALTTQGSPEDIRAKCSIPTISQSVEITTLQAPDPPVGQVPTKTATAERKEEDGQPAPDAEVSRDAVIPEPALHAAFTADNILRVDAERIDNVLNLVGELILAKSMLQQTLSEFGQRFPKDSLRGKFSDVMAFQSRILGDLQHSVMKIRMVPVDQLFRRFPRTVRDVARQGGKDVEIVIQGADTDLDKGILDAIAEPLMHILRNAVGHGIETPEERTRAGKRPRGTLRFNAYHQGNQVVIEVSDDGRGIDIEKIRQRALVQRMLTPDEAVRLSESETLDLILRPGFSTAEQITELSGRGIGLDVVQSVLTRLKGSLQIETAVGRGTTFRLRLPLTLAILRALLFRVDHRLYALPLNAVNEIARTTESEIHEVEHYEVLQLRNDVLPLLRLGAPPQPGLEAARQKAFVLVVHHGERKFGLIVHELAGEDELVIKALDDQSIKTDVVSGASILGDGRVVLILNLIALVERFTRTRGNTAIAGTGLLSNLNSIITKPESRAQYTAGSQA